MAEIEESLLKKKIDSYSSELKDFQAENELTVEITLNEYRKLIEEKATADYRIKKAEENKYTRDEENRKLKQKNKELEMKLFEYRKQYGELVESNKDEEEEDE
ncbi:MAG: hypothetical protein HFJ50_07340 [Clostridia bacterium]|jgi:hypothetical protein|nr:hypothetical protein [Clostridia bacterium]